MCIRDSNHNNQNSLKTNRIPKDSIKVSAITETNANGEQIKKRVRLHGVGPCDKINNINKNKKNTNKTMTNCSIRNHMLAIIVIVMYTLPF